MTDEPRLDPDGLKELADDLERQAFIDGNADITGDVDEEAAEEALADAEWEAAPAELAPDVEHEVADLDDRPIAVEAFAGIGGVGLGLERAGFQSAVQIEWDAAASRVLAARFPRAARFGDVRKVDGHAVRRAIGGRAVRLLAGGFPCQDLSVAGKRAGLAGERSGLYGELLRLLEELSPDWLVVENVPGLLSSEKGADFARFLGDLTGWEPAVPDDGWRNAGVCHGPRGTAAWRVLDARYFGVAQRRRRVFVVFHPRDRVAPAAVLLEPSGLRRHPAARVPSWARPAAGPVGAAVRGRDERADGGGAGNAPADCGVDTASTLQAAGGDRGWRLDAEAAAGGHIVPLATNALEGDVARALMAAGASDPHDYSQSTYVAVGEEPIPLLEVGARTGREGHEDRDGLGVGDAGDPMFTLQASKQHGVAQRQVGSVEAHGGEEISPTVTSKWAKGSGGPAGAETGNLVVEPVAAIETGQGFWTEADQAATLRVGGDPDTIVRDGEPVVVGDGGTEVTHPVTASGTDGMGRGVPAVAYGVTAKGNGEAYLTDTAPTLASGGGMPGQGYSAVLTEEPAAYIIDKERGLPNPEGISVEGTDVAPTITADGDPAERTDRGLRIPQSYAPDVAASLTAGSHSPGVSAPGRRHEDDTNLIAGPTPFIVEPESGQGADLVLREADHSPTLTAMHANERGIRVAETWGFTQDTRMDTPTEEASSPLRVTLQAAVAHPVGVDVLNQDVTGDTAHTLRGGHDQGTPRVLEGPRSAVRRLTPRECERLQGFPDDWTLVPDKNGKPAADSPRYKQLGNAVCATVSEWLTCRIADYDDGTLYLDLP